MPEPEPNDCAVCARHPRDCLYKRWQPTQDEGAGAGVRFSCHGFEAELGAASDGHWWWRVRGPGAEADRVELLAGRGRTRLGAMRALADALGRLDLLGKPPSGELVTAMILCRARGLAHPPQR